MTSRALRALAALSAVVLLVTGIAFAASRLVPSPIPSATPGGAVYAIPARVIVSLPRAGARRAQSEGITNAVRLAIEEANARITTGDVSVTIDIESVDTSGADGAWSEALERASLERALADRSVLAYVGPGTLAGARTVAALAAQQDLLFVTPTVTHPALTTRGYDDALYEALHPAGQALLLRTIPSDEDAGRALARWARARDYASSVVGSADDPWSRAFAAAAGSGGRLRFVYVGGGAASAAADLAKELHAEGAALGGAESLLAEAFLEGAGPAAEGAVATFAGRPAERYTGPAGTFQRAYRERFLVDPDPYAIFGYDAARLVLDALRRSRQSGPALDRGSVRAAALATKDLEGALGTWSIEPSGASTYRVLQLYVVRALPGGGLGWTWDAELRP